MYAQLVYCILLISLFKEQHFLALVRQRKHLNLAPQRQKILVLHFLNKIEPISGTDKRCRVCGKDYLSENKVEQSTWIGCDENCTSLNFGYYGIPSKIRRMVLYVISKANYRLDIVYNRQPMVSFGFI